LAVREASHGQESLRDVFQWMNDNYAKKGRFFADSDGVRQAAEAVTRADLGWFFTKYVQGTEEIPWNDFFRTVGLSVVAEKTTTADPGFSASRNFDGPMIVSAVTTGSEADRAGLRSGDTISEINGKTPGLESSDDMAGLAPDDAITLRVRGRRGTERELKWKAGRRDELTYDLRDIEHITAEQQARRAAWLKGEAQLPQTSKSH
jgi:predicted metalloprotease with PDZ domain